MSMAYDSSRPRRLALPSVLAVTLLGGASALLSCGDGGKKVGVDALPAPLPDTMVMIDAGAPDDGAVADTSLMPDATMPDAVTPDAPIMVDAPPPADAAIDAPPPIDAPPDAEVG